MGPIEGASGRNMSEENPQKTDPKSKRILVVDDEPDIRQLFSFVLAEEGFQAEFALDGEAAIEKVAVAAPDFMILDLMLPKLTGLDVLERLQQENMGKFPILVVSGVYKSDKIGEQVRSYAQVIDFLEKPVKLPVLKKLIHDTLGTQPPP